VGIFAKKTSSRAPLEKRAQFCLCIESLKVGDEPLASKLERLERPKAKAFTRLTDHKPMDL